MPKQKIQKQMLWDARSTQTPDSSDEHHFILAIIDIKTASNKAMQKTKEILQPTDGHRDRIGKIKSTQNHYRIVDFCSYRYGGINNISWSNIYDGPVKRDTNLWEREGRGILENYIESLAKSGKLS